MSLSKLRYDNQVVEFDLAPVDMEDFITKLDTRELLYDISVAKKIAWAGEYTIPFIMLNSEVIDTVQQPDILEAVAKDLPAYMLRNIVFSQIDNIAAIDVMIGDMVLITEVIPENTTAYSLNVFSGNSGIVIGSIASSDIALHFTSRNPAAPSSVVVNTIETYVLMSKLISSTYTHKAVLHEIPLIYKYLDYTFLFDKESIAVYNEDVDLSTWRKHMKIDEHPYHTTSDEYKSIEMDISNPSVVLEGLPGFDKDETNVDLSSLTDAGVYRVPIKASEEKYAEKYLQSHPNVVKFEIKDLAFVTQSEREKNIRHSNKLTVKLYNQLRMLIGDGEDGGSYVSGDIEDIIGFDTDDEVAEIVGDDTEDITENVGEEATEDTAENTSENTSENAGENAGENTGENTGENAGDEVAEIVSEDTTENTGENAGENSDNTGDATEVASEVTAEDTKTES